MAGLLKPLAHGEMTGTAELHPSRYDNRLTLVDSREIGASPLYFNHMEREAWNELVDRLWWLNASDYTSVEMTARMIAHSRLSDSIDLMVKVIGALGKLGATPTSRGNVLADRSKDGAKKSRFDK